MLLDSVQKCLDNLSLGATLTRNFKNKWLVKTLKKRLKSTKILPLQTKVKEIKRNALGKLRKSKRLASKTFSSLKWVVEANKTGRQSLYLTSYKCCVCHQWSYKRWKVSCRMYRLKLDDTYRPKTSSSNITMTHFDLLEQTMKWWFPLMLTEFSIKFCPNIVCPLL